MAKPRAVSFEKAEELLGKAVTELLRKEPFFAHVLQQLRRRIDQETPTAAVALVRGDIELRVNPEFFASLNARERVAVLKHEVLHVVLKHLARNDYPDATRWNIACDLVINEHVEPWPLPDGALRFAAFPDLVVPEDPTADQVYRALDDHPALSKAMSEQGAPLGGHSDHSGWASDGGDDQETAADVSAASVRITEVIRRAAQRSSGYGNLPASIRNLVEMALNPPTAAVDWKRILRIFAASAGRTRIVRTRQRESERYGTFPGIRVRRTRRIVVAIDTSGSVEDALLQRFFAEVIAIHRSGTQVVVVGCDAVVHDSYTFDGKIRTFTGGGGGTAFDPVFEWINGQQARFDACVYLTDGCASPPIVRPNCRLLWALSEHVDPPLPFGASVLVGSD